MNAWLASLSARDRRVLVVGVALIALALLWAFAWDPLSRSRASLAQRVTQAEADLAWMRGAAGEMRAARAQGATTGLDRAGRSLLALADGSAREAGLGGALRRVEPSSAGRVNVWFEGVPFDPLTAWLESLAQRYGVGVDELVVDRADGVGTVNARLTLVDAATD